MAYVNVAEWKTDQVCEWLKGLENSVLPYVHSFTNNCVNGQQLLNLRPEDLEQLGVLKLGHQEIILQAVEYLRNFHYELDRENLQLLALHLSCQSHSLHNELSRHTDSKPVTTQILSDVASVMTAVKPLVRWLDKPPFSGQLEYNDKKTELLKLSLEMATCAQRDRFAEKPIEEIRGTCEKLAKLADYIIQDIADPMILQPASLDLATLKKRPGDDLGFYILKSFHGNHQIAEIKFGSAAHTCGKMEEGDEIVQVNYQTVVGWEKKNVLELFSESPAEMLLTLKRRPRHTKVYGQIYIKPYRLPSNKKTPYATRWQHNLPSPRPELLTIPDFTMPLPRNVPKEPSPEPASIIDTVGMLDTMASSDSGDSDSEVETPLSTRLYTSKPRNLVQRRATITGASPTTKHAIDIEQFWKELKQEHSTAFHLRDKAASCAHGLDNVQSSNRPQTCLGMEQTKRKRRYEDERRVQFSEKISVETHSEAMEKRMGVEEDSQLALRPEKKADLGGGAALTPSNNTNSDRKVPLEKKFMRDEIIVSCQEKFAEGGVSRSRKDRGKLDKSHSTPAYDLSTDMNLMEIRDMRDYPCVSTKISNNAEELAQQANSITIINETDKHLSKRTVDISRNEEEESFGDSRGDETIGSVAQQVNKIESWTRTREREERILETAQTKIVDGNSTTEGKNSTEEILKCPTSSADAKDVLIHEKSSFSISKIPEVGEFSRESSEDKSESTSSYVEGIYSSGGNSSSETEETLKKSIQAEDSSEVGSTSLEMLSSEARTIEPKNANSRDEKEAEKCSKEAEERRKKGENIASPQKPINTAINRDCASQQCEESAKNVTPRKIEAKNRQTPPEPPPRKYFTKQPPRMDYKKIAEQSPEISTSPVPDNSTASASFQAPINPEGFRDFVDRSIDFIDEPPPLVPRNEEKSASTTLTDIYGYTEIYESNSRQDKISNERYESFYEKFGNGSANGAADNGLPELPARGCIDSTDGSGSSKQAQNFDGKTKTLEKEKNYDKGVVNRAMMVARSIGLHGGSNKSSGNSGSPRSIRKRNLLLAKRRNVSVKDVGAGDLEGWLTYRSRGAGGAWARSWFVLKNSSLYRFKAQDSMKSDCLIALPGFTASTAVEVKSRKHAFKVYHTGTVFYFAADTDDTLALWLDAINRATLGADSHNRTSGLFSETDESDTESPKSSKTKSANGGKACHETTMFGSLKKIGRKDSNYEKHENVGASLDRKFSRFLGSSKQNVPVPTPQFRSYRRVLPTSAPSRKQDSSPNSPDLRVTVAGSTFYGLSGSQSTNDVPSTSQDMGDYRQTTDSNRSQGVRGRRSDDLRGFVTLEEFMLAHQNEDRRVPAANNSQNSGPLVTPLTSDHVHVHHRNFEENGAVHAARFGDPAPSNGMIYGHPRNGEETDTSSFSYDRSRPMGDSRLLDERASGEKSGLAAGRNFHANHRLTSGISTYGLRKNHEIPASRQNSDQNQWQNISNEIANDRQQGRLNFRQLPVPKEAPGGASKYRRDSPRVEPRNDQHLFGNCAKRDNYRGREASDGTPDVQLVPRRFTEDNGHAGSNGDLTCCASSSSSEMFQRGKKSGSIIGRKESFNLADRQRRERLSPDRHWLESLTKSGDKRGTGSAGEKSSSRLKNVAQYQPPPIPGSPFEQDGMRAAFEMHLDKGEQVQKTNRLKSLFGGKSPQKPNTLDLPKDSPKTLLGSPRLHRALFRDKSSSQRQASVRSGSQSPGDSGISQSHTLSQSYSSVSSMSDWSPDTPTPNTPKCATGHASCHKKFCNTPRSAMSPPTLPYIPPPTSPPPDDYPGLEYPPVFEPGTYSLTDPSLMRNRGKTDSIRRNRDPNDDTDNAG